MSSHDQPITTYLECIQTTVHHDGPERGYFWRISASGLGGAGDWTGPEATADDAAAAAVAWLIRQAQQLRRITEAAT